MFSCIHETVIAWGRGLQKKISAVAGGQESPSPVQQGVPGNTAVVSSLIPGVTYYFEIRATTALGVSPLSNEASATLVPAVPAQVVATAGDASVSLTWSASSGATSYDVYEGTSGRVSAAPVRTGIAGTSATVSGLTNGTTYDFTVTAVDAGGASAQSSRAGATPAAPSSGGGAIDWIGLSGLAALVLFRRRDQSAAAATSPFTAGRRTRKHSGMSSTHSHPDK